ncbi:ATP-grasp domain-containing protein [Jatrophihabitans sp.]|jgi:biotin carboxylase|uniref:ATP-grasp domain-containing protein n=1 Tax=Jatrophihabitans sp. TaxID=1932789 RepID=UPI002F23D117
MNAGWLILLESNTTGSGELFCAAARRLGLRPVVFARDPGRYPYLAENRIDTCQLDTGDRLAVRKAADELAGVVGVTSSSEYFAAAAAELAGGLGLPHPDPAAIAACRDKATQRRLLRAQGVAGPAFATATSPHQAVELASSLGLPVVLKPVSGSGSVGVRLCHHLGEVAEGAGAALAGELAGIPAQRAVLVESCLDGPEFSVETFGTQVVGITAKHLGASPYFVETGHDFPAPLPPAARAALAQTALRALVALGLGWGPAHVELRLGSTGPAVIEVNPRLAGGMIPNLVRSATGVDLIAAAVANAAGLPVRLAPSRAAGSAIRFLVAQRSGYFVAADGLDRAAACPQLSEAVLTRRPGVLTLEHSFRDRVGYLIAVGRDSHDAAAAADRALACVHLRIEPVQRPALLAES